MKTTNKGFTIVELLVLLVIIAIVATLVAGFVNIFKLLFWVLVYFSIPGIIFGVILKLNQKYRWVVKGKYDRYIGYIMWLRRRVDFSVFQHLVIRINLI